MTSFRRLERRDVRGLLWRKKIDASLFRTQETPIPKWVARMWEIPKHFPNLPSKQTESNKIQILWGNSKSWEKLNGWLLLKSGRDNEYKIRFSKIFSRRLVTSAPGSFFEALESALSHQKDEETVNRSHWEFLDIEFIPEDKTFRCRVYFNQKTDFPNLFQALINSPLLAALEQEHLLNKTVIKAQFSSWKSFEGLGNQVETHNCIYTLLDSKSRKFYIGQASNLLSRLKQHHKNEAANWTEYRYCTLPAELSSHREVIERLIINLMADLFPTSDDERGKLDVDYLLTNLKVT